MVPSRSCFARIFGLALFVTMAATSFSLSAKSADISFATIVDFVRAKGWSANLGTMCATFELEQRDCRFRQIMFYEGADNDNGHGLNVPATADSEQIPFVLIFHLRPLVGEFFVVSYQGDLLKTFYRTRGAGYSPLPNAEAIIEFEKDLSHWKQSFEKIRRSFDGSSVR